MEPSSEDFIRECQSSKLAKVISRNSYTHWGELTVYMRVGPRYIDGVKHDRVIDIANVQAKHTGRGTFKKFVKFLRDTFPEYALYVESVLTDRFSDGLLRMGFTLSKVYSNCFYMLAVIGDFQEDHHERRARIQTRATKNRD